MGHISNYHDDDDETSEYGVGLKAGSLSTANQLEIITKVPSLNNYYLVIADFERMSNEINVNDSYNPIKNVINDDEYSNIHPFNYGSTIKITKIRNDEIYYTTTIDEITNKLLDSIGKTYAKLLNNCEIRVNDKIVVEPYNFFEDKNCIPFKINILLFILEDEQQKYLYLYKKYINNEYKYSIYSVNEKKWKLCNKDTFTDYIKKYNNVYTSLNNNGYCMEINTIFTFYSNIFHNDNNEDIDLPQDMVNIYKDNRLYGSKSLEKHNNGVHNYTLHEIKFRSKKIGKILGITYNKEITMNGSNDLIICIKTIFKENRTKFTSDTGTSKNCELCKKAIDEKLIDLLTCPIEKLSKTHLQIRNQINNNVNKRVVNNEIINEIGNDEIINEIVNDEIINEIINDVVNNEIVHDEIINDVVNNDIVNNDIVNDEIINEIVNDDIVNDEIINEIVNDEIINDEIINQVVNNEIINDKIINELVNNEIINDEIINQVVNDEIINQVINDEIINQVINDEIINQVVNNDIINNDIINDEIINQVVNNEIRNDEIINQVVNNEIINDEIINQVVNNEIRNDEIINQVVNNNIRNDEIINQVVNNEIRNDEIINQVVNNEIINQVVNNKDINEVIDNKDINDKNVYSEYVFQNTNIVQNDYIEIREQKTRDLINKLNLTISYNNILELDKLIKIESIL